jgi:hypothetical protein
MCVYSYNVPVHSQVFYEGCSPIRTQNGRTFVLLDGETGETVRMKQRIPFKMALDFLLKHFDVENSPKNIFLVRTRVCVYVCVFDNDE